MVVIIKNKNNFMDIHWTESGNIQALSRGIHINSHMISKIDKILWEKKE